jgi:phenylpyruvate tautomerase PptA (4-oxalocrotonate tautomerase family)
MQVTEMSENRAQHDTEKTHYIAEGISAVESEHVGTHKDTVDAAFDDLDLHNTLASKADDSDGKTTWSFRKLLAAISLAGFYVGGAIPTLLIGASLQYIAEDLNAEFASWLIMANTLGVAASTPFVGYLTDLVGSSTVQRPICFHR